MINDNLGKRRKKLKVNIPELASEMDLGDNLELTGYLDTETGEIISMPDDVMRAVDDRDGAAEALPDWEQELVETAESILSDEKNRFLLIPRRESREGYELMAAFAETVTNRDLREKLAISLDGKGAFRRFKNVLNHHPDVLDRWYAFKDESIQKRRSSGFLITASSRCKWYPATSMTTGPRSTTTWSPNLVCA